MGIPCYSLCLSPFMQRVLPPALLDNTRYLDLLLSCFFEMGKAAGSSANFFSYPCGKCFFIPPIGRTEKSNPSPTHQIYYTSCFFCGLTNGLCGVVESIPCCHPPSPNLLHSLLRITEGTSTTLGSMSGWAQNLLSYSSISYSTLVNLCLRMST